MADHIERLQRVLRGLSGGTDPTRLLHEVLAAVVAATRANQGILFGVIDGAPTPLATSGVSLPVLLDAGEAAIERGRMSRKSEPKSSLAAAGEPIRVGDRIVGSLAVCGESKSLDLTSLGTFGALAGAVMARRPTISAVDAGTALAEMAALHGDPDEGAVLVHAFDAAEHLFEVGGGFCALRDGREIRVAHIRNLDRDRLREATRHPQFGELVDSAGVIVEDPTHPVVARITDGLEHAVGLPLTVAGRRLGQIVLLVGTTPDAAMRALLGGFARNVSLALRAAEQFSAVDDAEERLASVVHSMPEPVLVVDEVGRFTLINSAAADVFQLSETFEIGHDVAGRLGQPDLEAMLAEGLEGTAEVMVGRTDPRLHRATVRRVVAPGGRRLGRVLVLRDIAATARAEQTQADFVAVIGHELRTPITILKTSVRTLDRGGRDLDDERWERLIDAMGRGVSRLERLIDDLLLVSDLDSGERTVRREEVDVGWMVDQLASDRITVHRPRRMDPLIADQGKLGQVLYHLVDNAMKYSDGEITVEVLDGDAEMTFSVTDEGPGIYSGDITALFERFRQGDGSATRAQGGTGMGLYIARRLVEAHGGRIWCDSRLEVGSTFSFTIPRVSDSITVRADERESR